MNSQKKNCKLLEANFEPIGNDITLYRGCNYLELSQNPLNEKIYNKGFISCSSRKYIASKFIEERTNIYEPALLGIKVNQNTNLINVEAIFNKDAGNHEEEYIIRKRAILVLREERICDEQELCGKGSRNIKGIHCLKLELNPN